jgi:hypothetical protein
MCCLLALPAGATSGEACVVAWTTAKETEDLLLTQYFLMLLLSLSLFLKLTLWIGARRAPVVPAATSPGARSIGCQAPVTCTQWTAAAVPRLA